MCTVTPCAPSRDPAVNGSVALHDSVHSATLEAMEFGDSIRNIHGPSFTTYSLSSMERDPYSVSGVASRSNRHDFGTGHS